MTKLIWDSSFKRAYKKRISNYAQLKIKFWIALELFSENPVDKNLKTHKLTGKLRGMWAFSVDNDCRVIFKFANGTDEVLLIDIGTHDEVY